MKSPVEPPDDGKPKTIGKLIPDALSELQRGLRHPKPRRGIPTTYSGVTFRSRHEASFAMLFDALAWPWSYEPTDLPGYIPDFSLEFASRPLLVEIKSLEEDMDLAKSKIECTGWTKDAAIFVTAESKILGEVYEEGLGWDRAVLAKCMVRECLKATVISEAGRWSCRSCGAGKRDLWFAFDARQLWLNAKNNTQWRPGT